MDNNGVGGRGNREGRWGGLGWWGGVGEKGRKLYLNNNKNVKKNKNNVSSYFCFKYH